MGRIDLEKAVLTQIVRIRRIKSDSFCVHLTHRVGELAFLRKYLVLFALSVSSASNSAFQLQTRCLGLRATEQFEQQTEILPLQHQRARGLVGGLLQ